MGNAFQTFTAREVFAELHGFVLADPRELDRHHGGSAKDLNLLALYAASDEGDFVAAAGIAIPVMGLEAGDYTLVVRSVEVGSLLADQPRLVSSGWVLHVVSSQLCLCGAGYMTKWDPENSRVLHPAVPTGWYEVEVRCGFGGADGDEAVVEFVLRPTKHRPAFTADLGTAFDFTSMA